MTRKPTDLLGLGDTLAEALYARQTGAGEPMLLLAAGQRIESVQQLHRLRQAGFRVDLPVEAAAQQTSQESDRARRLDSSPSPTPTVHEQGVQKASRVRQVIHEAARDLMGRIRAGAAPDIRVLEEASSALVAEVTREPATIAALTHLHQCDDYTVEHSADVAILMVAMARLLETPDSELNTVALSGILHDVGKLRVPPSILKKPGRPTPEEFEELRRHPLHGYEMLRECPELPEVVPLVALQHHERTDGSGYPNRLTGPEIHPYSLISAVADSFDAMTSDRCYHRGNPPRQALLELYTLSGTRLDARAVDALVKLVGVYPVGTRVALDTGERGVVIAANPNDATRPTVRIDQDYRGQPVAACYLIELQSSPCRIVAASP